MLANEPDEVGEHIHHVIRSTLRVRRLLINRKARLLHDSKYKDRVGVITDVMPDASYGFRACLMILKQNSNRFVDSDSESRAYRPLDQMELLDEEQL